MVVVGTGVCSPSPSDYGVQRYGFSFQHSLLILFFFRLGHALQYRVCEVGQDDSEHTVPDLVQFHAYFSCSAASAIGLVRGVDLPRQVADERNAVLG